LEIILSVLSVQLRFKILYYILTTLRITIQGVPKKCPAHIWYVNDNSIYAHRLPHVGFATYFLMVLNLLLQLFQLFYSYICHLSYIYIYIVEETVN